LCAVLRKGWSKHPKNMLKAKLGECRPDLQMHFALLSGRKSVCFSCPIFLQE